LAEKEKNGKDDDDPVAEVVDHAAKLEALDTWTRATGTLPVPVAVETVEV